jgi:hypothetical protein
MEGGLINFSSFLLFFTTDFFLSSVVIFSDGREQFDTTGSGVLDLEQDVGINIKLAVVTNANGGRIILGDKNANDRPTIVIFLRHLACPYCWSYAKE